MAFYPKQTDTGVHAILSQHGSGNHSLVRTCKQPKTFVTRLSIFSMNYLLVWKKCYMKCGVWNQLKIWSSHLLDNLSNCLMNLKNSGDSTRFEPMTMTMGHGHDRDSNPWPWSYNTSYNTSFILHSFPGKHEPNKLTCSQLCDFIAQLVKALHRHRRGHGLESRWVTWIFQVHETIA